MESIRDTGSIAAGVRGMGMPYKRAWLPIDSIDQAFHEPAMAAARWRAPRGSARLAS